MSGTINGIVSSVGIVSGVYDERGSYQKVVNVDIQSDIESIQNVFIVVDKDYDLN